MSCLAYSCLFTHSADPHNVCIRLEPCFWWPGEQNCTIYSLFSFFGGVSTNSWGQCLSECCAVFTGPLLVCVWCSTGTVQWLYQSFFAENSCPEMTLIRADRVNQNSDAVGRETKTVHWKMLKRSTEPRGTARPVCKSLWIYQTQKVVRFDSQPKHPKVR